MYEIIHAAIPFFVILLVLEGMSYYLLPDEDKAGYEARDTRTSLIMGAGSVLVNIGWKAVVLVVYSALYMIAPIHLSGSDPLTWALLFAALFVAEDLCFYAYHRSHHTVRLFWASHVVHHSSEHYNLSTALRQPWTPFTALPFWLPLVLVGFPPWMILMQQSISLLYQFFLHTERIGKLWAPVEFVMNTPSHHRVHHGSNARYLDRNYGGILILWDRLFGTFEAEGERVVFGLTKNVNTFNPLKVAFHEFAAIARDVRTARRPRDVLGYLFAGPGWEPTTVTHPARPSAGAPRRRYAPGFSTRSRSLST